MTKLENWAIIFSKKGTYDPPELSRAVLTGQVYGHPKFKDGEHIVTSAIQSFDVKNATAKTTNTEYQLGVISKEFDYFLANNGFTLDQYEKVAHEKSMKDKPKSDTEIRLTQSD